MGIGGRGKNVLVTLLKMENMPKVSKIEKYNAVMQSERQLNTAWLLSLVSPLNAYGYDEDRSKIDLEAE